MRMSSDSRAPVLVGVDRLGSGAAVRYAALEALRTGRPLHLIHIAPTSDGWDGQVGRDALRGAVHQAESVLTGRSEVVGSLVRGSVIPELARLAADAALLVMERVPSAQRRPTTTRATEAITAAVDTPVAVIPSDWIDAGRNVVSLGLEPAAVDEHAVRAALVLARLHRAVLRVVVSGDTARSAVIDVLNALGGDACDLAVEVVTEPPRVALARAAATSDLLVLGRGRPDRPEGSRLGPVGAAVLDDLVCPVLFTAPGHRHHASGPVVDDLVDQPMLRMYARPGDRVVVRAGLLGAPVRDGEVLEVEHADGSPPYRVQWSDDGRVSLYFPGPDAYIDPSSGAAAETTASPTAPPTAPPTQSPPRRTA